MRGIAPAGDRGGGGRGETTTARSSQTHAGQSAEGSDTMYTSGGAGAGWCVVCLGVGGGVKKSESDMYMDGVARIRGAGLTRLDRDGGRERYT